MRSPAQDILVLDADMPHAIAIVRSIARRADRVHVAAAVAKPIAGRSRHVHASHQHPDPMHDEEGFVAWLAGQADRYRLVIPVTERTLVPLMRHRTRFPEGKLALPDDDALATVLDKDRTFALAGRLGVPTPKTIAVERMEDLASAASVLPYPIVVKPARSIGTAAARMVQLNVAYAFDPGELRRKAGHALNYGSVLLQEYFRGEGVGIELIADRGQICYAFQHRRLHELPLTGGGSTLRESVPVEPALLEASRLLVRALGWHGVAMVEFKRDADSGEFRLMEINGRFWGSLPLAIAAGADFPAMLVELMTEHRVAPRPPARLGIRCCKLAGDVDWYERVLRRDGDPRLVRFPSRSAVLSDLLNLASFRTRFDVQSWRDPWPGLVDIGRILATQWTRAGSQLQQRRKLKAQLKSWRDGSVITRLRTAQKILFVCYGNINRSALAEIYFNQSAGRHAPVVTSCGFHSEVDRPADPVMRDVAAEHGVPLEGHRSGVIQEDLVATADVILVMEQNHIDRLLALYPSARDRTFLLGPAATLEGYGIEVADPYGQPRDAYVRCFEHITACVGAVLTETVRGTESAKERSTQGALHRSDKEASVQTLRNI